ncbi:ABC transporter ATP-binding protein [Leifsonia sp. NPDC058248]|uniref:ABC transporter ATP-binding protein n=1 Tax=Leifsonia sp. NPDC058248 TaxID=3346402 RepID=UPI0036DDC314
MNDVAVSVDHLSLKYRLYRERNNALKTALLRGRKSVYEDFWALRDISFEVPTGTTFGLVGRNGSGKSTLLKCLSRILYPDKGGFRANGKMASLLELGSGFHPELSGRENVFLNGSILGMSRKDISRKFDEIVDFSGIEKFIDQPVKNYSSGMYVRLGFAVAINVEPDILVVDEVLAVGDAEFREKCAQKFRDFKEDGRTVILVTHSMRNLKDMCDSAAWLDKGQLRKVGDADTVIASYERALKDGR